mmetsp:Transcript_88456/g.245644  ORF Transcript_88456/g.245644 Transcript_88456/m.245644 type:complete len:743 (-) Transcript_88456:31-2259(-)
MTAEEVLGESIVRLLSDKPYERRKQAAQEIEAKVREALARPAGGGIGQVQRILDCLRRDYIESPQGNHKKGGLIGLASVAIGLEVEIAQFLPPLVLPVLELFKDEDARVRYYACEALYNITKVASESVLPHFNEIFDGLCKLYADVDTDVKNGVQVLDRLMKDIVTQYAPKFRVTEFVPLLAQRMHFRNPFIRQLVLAWITLLLKVPEVDMVRHIPQYLDGLFNMLGDQSRDIRHNADACLNELLKGVTSIYYDKALQIISDTAAIVVRCCFASDACSRLTALCWLHTFVHLEMKEGSHVTGKPNDSWVPILPNVLGGTLHCIDDPEEEIARMAIEINSGLLEMVQKLQNDIPVDKLVDQLLQSMQSKESMVIVRTACLQWICMLLVQSPAQMLQRNTLKRLLQPIFDTLMDADDEVVVAALRVLAQIMEGRNVEEDDLQDEGGEGDLFTVVAHRLLKLFASDRQMLETRGRLMIRQLCGHLNPRRLYVTVARAIQHEIDIEFAQQLVQTFSWILLTATETRSLREELLETAPLSECGRMLQASRAAQHAAPPAIVTPLFLELLEPWFHNPVSALALCLWAQQYELASELTARFAAFEPTLDLLKQLDQLVHLLESPVFSRLRLRLLEPRRHPALLKCLLGLAMLLPQAGAFSILRERLHVAQSGLLLEAPHGGGGGEPLPARDAPASESGSGSGWWPGGRAGGSGARTAEGPDSGGGRCDDTDLPTLLQRFDTVAAAAMRC